jgi:hypothetical protein
MLLFEPTEPTMMHFKELLTKVRLLIQPHFKSKVNALLLASAILLGLIHSISFRNLIHADGLAYLEVGEAYIKGDWEAAINGLWSPLYSWLIGLAFLVVRPTPSWEAPLIHLLNFIIFLFALGGFNFFLKELTAYQRLQVTSPGSAIAPLPDWALAVFGYVLFTWSTLDLITVTTPSPDLCVAGIIYLVAGLIVRIRRGMVSHSLFITLGALLAVGYLAKTAMVFVGVVFLAAAIAAVGNLRRGVIPGLISAAVFLAIAGPFVGALSWKMGRLTFGESGVFNYVRHVNGDIGAVHWQGGPTDSGTPAHPSRKVHDSPDVYEFSTPFNVTYPPWHDPSYWHDGISMRFLWKKQARAVIRNAKVCAQMLFAEKYTKVTTRSLMAAMYGGLIVLMLGNERRRLIAKDIASYWFLLIPALVGVGAYVMVHLEPRYVGAFAALSLLALFASIRVPPSDSRSSRLVKSVVTLVLLLSMFSVGRSVYGAVRYEVPALISGRDTTGENWQHEVADALQTMGIHNGDRVGFIGTSYRFYWARLIGARVIAELREARNVETFWSADPSVKDRVLRKFAECGATVIVADNIPDGVTDKNWRKIGNTDYCLYDLKALPSHE